MTSSPTHFNSPFALIANLWRYRDLIVQLTRRDVLGRYRGSVLGITWSFFNPLFMLAVYTIVFSGVFGAKWGVGGDSKAAFAIMLFAGMIVHGLFAEMLNRAPGLIFANMNYVKKVVFPLHILPIVVTGSAFFHTLISLTVLLLAFYAFNGHLPWTSVFIPLILLPLIILTLGLSWVLASIGVFVRDVQQAIGMITTALMFLSPVFYPISAVPARFRPFMLANPTTFIIEQVRAVLVYGKQPDWLGLGIYAVAALIIAWLGYLWFQKTRGAFADIV